MALRVRPLYALHLLWTVPIAVAFSIPLFFFGIISICGVSGCGGGGFGPAYGPDYEWVVPFAIIGALLALAIGLVPWQKTGVRWAVGLIVGGIISAWLISNGYTSKYPMIER